MTDILIILGLILLNGVLAMSELAVVSARRLRLEKLAADGNGGARAALGLAANPSRFLSTIQVGITLVSIFNGAFGEASLAGRLAPWLAQLPLVGAAAHALAFALVVGAITAATIILGELVPKRIAIQHPELAASVLARPLATLSTLLAPVVRLLALATDAIMRVLGMPQRRDDTPTEEEISGMIREGAQAGLLEQTESVIAARALRLDDRPLRALMTPRVDIVFVDLDEPPARILDTIAASRFSRFPVRRRDASRILGYVRARDLFEQAIRAGSVQAVDIAAAIKPMLFVPEPASAMDVLELFTQHRTELALVVDEYGEIQGLVTLADVMSVLVGEVSVGAEAQAPDAVQREDGSWLLDGGMSLDRFRELFGAATTFPGEASGTFHTLAGFVLCQLGYIPAPSAHVLWNGWRLEVLDMDGNRIDRLLFSGPDLPAPAKTR